GMLHASDPRNWVRPVNGGPTDVATIGLYLDRAPGAAVVIQVDPGSPARRAGICPGDTVVEAGGLAASSSSSSIVERATWGPRGTPVAVTFKRAGSDELVRLEIVRDACCPASSSAEMLP